MAPRRSIIDRLRNQADSQSFGYVGHLTLGLALIAPITDEDEICSTIAEYSLPKTKP